MIRAAALLYAIVFSLLVGLICSGIIFIASTQKKIEILSTNKEHLLLDSYAAIQYGINSLSIGDSSSMVHQSGDTSKIDHLKWGAFSVICAKTSKNNKFKRRVAIVGSLIKKDWPCIYLSGNTGGLKISGDTELNSSVFVPNKLVEQAYITNKNYKGDKLVYGEINKAENSLPELEKEIQNLTHSDYTNGLIGKDYLDLDSSYSFFDKTTYYTSINSIEIQSTVSGRVIIHSFDSIYVRAKSHLTNVILIAPNIRFEAGFVGKVQAIAHEKIVLEENVQLLFPSILVLNEQVTRKEFSKREVLIREKAIVLGGILITSQSKDFRKLPKLQLSDNVTIGGLIYNQGESELKGEIIGSVYTDKLILNYGGGEYGNCLLDVKISPRKLPRNFSMPNWIKDESKQTSKIIEWL